MISERRWSNLPLTEPVEYVHLEGRSVGVNLVPLWLKDSISGDLVGLISLRVAPRRMN